MTQEELEILAKKIEEGIATEDEELAFYEALDAAADELLVLADAMPDMVIE